MNPTQEAPQAPVIYPESDGKPMAENTLQLRWIMLLVGNLQALFADDSDVFVAGNQNWYPVHGCPTVVMAPDAYVVFGRPKGDRSSYRQWEEGDTPMTVVFEVLSPSNTAEEMVDKHLFYDDHGVEEYYVYDPDRNHLEVYVRGQATLTRRWLEDGQFVSPRLGIRFDLTGPGEMRVWHADGRPFLSFEELTQQAQQDRARAREAEAARRAADEARQAAEEARQREAAARQAADEARRVADEARRVAESRAARVMALSHRARRGLATAEELAELDRLEAEAGGPDLPA